MNQPAINNQMLLDASNLAIARLSRFSSSTETDIHQSFLVRSEYFCGIRFEVGPFTAQWLFNENWIVFKRGDQLIEEMPFGADESEKSATRRAA